MGGCVPSLCPIPVSVSLWEVVMGGSGPSSVTLPQGPLPGRLSPSCPHRYPPLPFHACCPLSCFHSFSGEHTATSGGWTGQVCCCLTCGAWAEVLHTSGHGWPAGPLRGHNLEPAQCCVSAAILPPFLCPMGASMWCRVCGLWPQDHLCWLVLTRKLGWARVFMFCVVVGFSHHPRGTASASPMPAPGSSPGPLGTEASAQRP